MQPTSDSGQTQSMPMRTPMDLFVHELSDMLSAEQIISGMLETAVASASNDQLKQGLQMHREQTDQHATNLRRCFDIIGQQPHPVVCYAAMGLTQSLQEGISASESPMVSDGLIAGGAVKTESLEIASYIGLIQKSQLMGQSEITQLLHQNLEQERTQLQQVQQVAQQLDQQAASMTGSMMAGEDQAAAGAT